MQITQAEIIILLYAVFLSLFNFFYDELPFSILHQHENLLSYGGGSLLATIFLIFIPDAVHFATENLVYPLLLLGFIVFLISEKYLYQHEKDPKDLEEGLYHLHTAGFFIDHFIKGFTLVTIILLEPTLGFLTAIPFFAHTLSSSIALSQIHKTSDREKDKIWLSSAITAGAIAGIPLEISPEIEGSVIAFVSGMMLFMVSRDVLPKKKEGKPLSFLLGVFTIFSIWLSLEYLV